MSMYLRNNRSYYLQILNYITILFSYYLLLNPNTSFHRGELIYSILSQNLMRVSSIAGKYSTFSDYQLLVMESKHLTDEEIKKEFTLASWRKQDDEVVKEHIEAAIKTSRIQTTMFMLNFLRIPKPQTLDALSILQVDRLHATHKNKLSTSKQRQAQASSDSEETSTKLNTIGNNEYFSGELLFHYIVLKMRDLKMNDILIAIVFVMIRIVVPMILDFLLIPDFSFANCKTSLTMVILVDINLMFFMFVNFLFYLQALTDIRQKKKILNQINQMANIYAEKSELTILPTLNVLDPQSMYTWRSLYTINQEYGRKFFIRHKIYIPFVLIILLIDFLLLYMITSYLSSNGRAKSMDFSVLSYVMLSIRVNFDILLYFIMTLAILVISASFNESYELPTDILRKLTFCLKNAKQFKYQYVFKDGIQKLKKGEEFVQTLPELDPIYCSLCDEMRIRWHPEEFDQKIDNLVDYYEDLLQSLESEKVNNVLTIAGIRISKQFIAKACTVIIPVILALQKSLLQVIITTYCKYPNRC